MNISLEKGFLHERNFIRITEIIVLIFQPYIHTQQNLGLGFGYGFHTHTQDHIPKNFGYETQIQTHKTQICWV